MERLKYLLSPSLSAIEVYIPEYHSYRPGSTFSSNKAGSLGYTQLQEKLTTVVKLLVQKGRKLVLVEI